jgi:hypothetical protein
MSGMPANCALFVEWITTTTEREVMFLESHYVDCFGREPAKGLKK